VFVCR